MSFSVRRSRALGASAFFLAAVSALSVAACRGGTEVSTNAAAAQSTSEGNVGLLPAPEWARCWLAKDVTTSDPFFQRHAVICSRPDVGATPFALDVVSVSAKGAGGRPLGARLDGANVEVRIGEFATDELPVSVRLETIPRFETGFGQNAKVFQSGDINIGLDDHDAAHPVQWKQPFDLWGIVVHAEGQGILEPSPFDVALAPFFGLDSSGGPRFDTMEVSPPVRSLAAGAFLTVAPSSGRLNAKLTVRTESSREVYDVTFDGPGTYRFANGTLVHESAGAVDGGAATLDATAPTPNPAEPPRSRGCGERGQVPCTDGAACASDAFLPAWSGVCAPCGGPEEVCCPATGCREGAFCSTGWNQCVACGQPGQACCGGACGEGARCLQSMNQCAACGGAGQLCCAGDTCGAGLTCGSFSRECH